MGAANTRYEGKEVWTSFKEQFSAVRGGINKEWWGTQEPSLPRSAPGHLGN